MIDYLVVDVETTIYASGNPYAQQNKLCLVGIREPGGNSHLFDIEYLGENYAGELEQIQELVSRTKLLVLFNAKFDLAWLRRYGIDFGHCRIFDCQLCDFILSGQVNSYPSLNGVALSYGLEQKLDEVAALWEQGVDTPNIPMNLLTSYLSQDLMLTEQVYTHQLSQLGSMPKAIQKLVSLSNQDLLVLQEMEWNGLKIDFEGMAKASVETQQQIENIRKELNEYFTGTPAYCLNYNSGDCLSALLYGGLIVEPKRIVIGEYKTGDKIGQPRYRIEKCEHVLPRRFEPPRGSALKKDGYFATSEEVLRSIKASKEGRKVLDLLLLMSKLEKLVSTYYEGLRKLHEEKDWDPGMLHGQFNQCMARTGRLSSSGPNLQNFPPEMDSFTVTRYG